MLYLQISVLAELMQDIAKGAVSGGRSVDVTGRQWQVVNAAQHLLQYDTVLRSNAAGVHNLHPILFKTQAPFPEPSSFPDTQQHSFRMHEQVRWD